jgi:hypothetical protein
MFTPGTRSVVISFPVFRVRGLDRQPLEHDEGGGRIQKYKANLTFHGLIVWR